MLHLASESSTSTLSKFNGDQVQPNAIDVRIDSMQRINSTEFVISEDDKQHRRTSPVAVEKNDGKEWFVLSPGTYEVVMDGLIHLGPDEAGFIITRSTLNRNGLFLTSGLYDSGYHGVMAGALHVDNGPARIARGTRIGQFLIWKAEALSSYDGSYGVGSEHDKKYES